MVSSSNPDAASRPEVRILPGHSRRLKAGHPWVYSNEIALTSAVRSLPPGTIVTLLHADGQPAGTAAYNPKPLIAARLLTRSVDTLIDRHWLAARLQQALASRELLFDEPYYRLIHAEADGLPGLIIDRYGPVCVAQLNTAAMDRLSDQIVDAIDAVLSPQGVVLRRDSVSRGLEGLELCPAEVIGCVTTPVMVRENGSRFLSDPVNGQKTGWFYDHRENRSRAARLAKGRRVLDLYCYLAGFGIQAANGGACEIVCVDRSSPALELAAEIAAKDGLSARSSFQKGEVFATLEQMARDRTRFDLVIADPPAFVKTRKDLKPGTRGYRKLARLASSVAAPSGILCIASCSHHVDMALFTDQVRRGIRDAGRSGILLHADGAGPDHPVHLNLPESAYLKCLFIQLD